MLVTETNNVDVKEEEGELYSKTCVKQPLSKRPKIRVSRLIIV